MYIIEAMHFTCNPAKNETNVRDRQLPLLAAAPMFDANMLVHEDVRRVYPERRFVGYNTLAGRWQVAGRSLDGSGVLQACTRSRACDFFQKGQHP